MFKCEDGFAYIRRFGSTISIEPQNVDENEENWYFVLKAERNLKLLTFKKSSDMMTWKFIMAYFTTKNIYILIKV